MLLRSSALERCVERCLACRTGGASETAALSAVLSGFLAPNSPAPGLVASAVSQLAPLIRDGAEVRSMDSPSVAYCAV